MRFLNQGRHRLLAAITPSLASTLLWVNSSATVTIKKYIFSVIALGVATRNQTRGASSTLLIIITCMRFLNQGRHRLLAAIAPSLASTLLRVNSSATVTIKKYTFSVIALGVATLNQIRDASIILLIIITCMRFLNQGRHLLLAAITPSLASTLLWVNSSATMTLKKYTF